MNLKHISGQTAEAMATLALVKEGFEVSLPVFTSPAFDIISKWGRAIHPIQVKTGGICQNGTTVQWHTCAHNRMYTEDDCSYFALVLIPRDEVWWMPLSEINGRRSVSTNINRDSLAEYRGNLEPLKAVGGINSQL